MTKEIVHVNFSAFCSMLVLQSHAALKELESLIEKQIKRSSMYEKVIWSLIYLPKKKFENYDIISVVFQAGVFWDTRYVCCLSLKSLHVWRFWNRKLFG